jgi:hypothetical protein
MNLNLNLNLPGESRPGVKTMFCAESFSNPAIPEGFKFKFKFK